jgi:hypothetical protein
MGGLMARIVPLREVAHARSGDKGNRSNIGLIALDPKYYPILLAQITAEKVKQHFRQLCHGQVERFELPNLHALNFVLHDALDGGGTVSLRTDAQGKTYSAALLRMPVELP